MSAAHSVGLAQRHTRRHPCPVCDGGADMAQGRGIRCAGFTSADGEYAHCTREERAGALDLDASTSPPSYAHRLHGPCRCGVTHNPAPFTYRPVASSSTRTPRPVRRTTHYELHDADGQLAGVHVRRDYADGGKSFAWERHNGRSSRDMPIYNLGAHLAAPASALRVVCEGETCADAINAAARAGGRVGEIIALATVTGAAASPCDDALRPLIASGAGRLTLWPDNDAVGRTHMQRIAARLVALGALEPPRIVRWDDAPEHGDAADYLAGAGVGGDGHRRTIAELLALVAAAQPAAPEPEPGWDADASELSGSPPLPSPAVDLFPLDALPPDARAFVRTVAAAIGCPADFVALPLLVYAGAAIGNSAYIEIKRGYREYARLWLAIVGEPGDRKSPALAAVHALVEERQRALYAEWAAARDDDDDGNESSAPPLTQLYTSDTTIEALGDLLRTSRRGVIMLRDELAGWALAMNQYKQRGADRQLWLSLWSGAPLLVNRRNRAGRPLYVDRPFVSVVGGIQPDVLGTLADERGRNDGFIHRLLFVYPDRAGVRRWTDAEIGDEAYAPMRALFAALYARDPETAPLAVTFTSKARELWREIANALYAEADAADFPDALRGPWAKLEAHVARLALVIHLMRAALDPGAVRDEARCDAESLAAAADVADYLKSHARRVYARLGARPGDVRALRLVGWLRDHGGTASARDLMRAGVIGLTTSDEARSALADLAARGWGQLATLANSHGAETVRFTLATVPATATPAG